MVTSIESLADNTKNIEISPINSGIEGSKAIIHYIQDGSPHSDFIKQTLVLSESGVLPEDRYDILRKAKTARNLIRRGVDLVRPKSPIIIDNPDFGLPLGMYERTEDLTEKGKYECLSNNDPDVYMAPEYRKYVDGLSNEVLYQLQRRYVRSIYRAAGIGTADTPYTLSFNSLMLQIPKEKDTPIPPRICFADYGDIAFSSKDLMMTAAETILHSAVIFLYLTGCQLQLTEYELEQLGELGSAFQERISNESIKYALQEGYLTQAEVGKPSAHISPLSHFRVVNTPHGAPEYVSLENLQFKKAETINVEFLQKESIVELFRLVAIDELLTNEETQYIPNMQYAFNCDFQTAKLLFLAIRNAEATSLTLDFYINELEKNVHILSQDEINKIRHNIEKDEKISNASIAKSKPTFVLVDQLLNRVATLHAS